MGRDRVSDADLQRASSTRAIYTSLARRHRAAPINHSVHAEPAFDALDGVPEKGVGCGRNKISHTLRANNKLVMHRLSGSLIPFAHRPEKSFSSLGL